MAPTRIALLLVIVAVAAGAAIWFLHDPSGQLLVRVTRFEALGPAVARPGDSPWWRGPAGDGKFATSERIPLTWGPGEHVAWSAPLPGRGHASPCVAGERVFVFTCDEVSKELLLLAYSRSDGAELWRRRLHQGGLMHTHGKNSHASATPACDGERVFANTIVDDQLLVWAVGVDGELRWTTAAGAYRSTHGYGSSPVLHESFVIVNGDNEGTGFIAALHRATGEIIWKTRRVSAASFGTPIVARLAGREQLLLAGAGRTTSYEPATGEEIWRCDGPATTCAVTVAVEGELVFTSGGYPEREILAIRADGSGDVSSTHVVWRTNKARTYVPSPLVDAGRLFIVNDDGIATCYRAATGDVLWQERLKGAFSASPVLIGERVLVTNESGRTYVFRSAGEFELLAECDLDPRGMATLVACEDGIFLRGESTLYRLATAGASVRRPAAQIGLGSAAR